MQHRWHTARKVREGHIYQLIPRCALTFSTLAGQQTQLSTEEILVGVTVLTIIAASESTPAIYELTAHLDGERKVFVVSQHKVVLQEERREGRR